MPKVISNTTPLLNELIDKGTWINPKLVDKVLIMAGEK
jgi:predicted nucleic acid-binding protein